jgi:hypothetical protein
MSPLMACRLTHASLARRSEQSWRARSALAVLAELPQLCQLVVPRPLRDAGVGSSLATARSSLGLVLTGEVIELGGVQ